MKKLNSWRYLFLFLLFFLPLPSYAAGAVPVVLLHGLARTNRSMKAMEKALTVQGYQVLNISYPSRKHPIEELAKIVRDEVLSKTAGIEKVHFVTHSLGGIILCYIQKHDPLPNIGRVVMLSPPSHGSEVVDTLADTWLFELVNGPAGSELGTGLKSVPQKLGHVDFELGVITGDRSINWINSLIIPGKDDGKVSVESAKVKGMKDFLIVHSSHPFIMRNKTVIGKCIYFLRNGRFDGSS